MRPLSPFALVLVAISNLVSGQSPCPSWSDDFALSGVEGQMYELLEHDDGSGRRLFVGGGSLRAGGLQASLLAWDGTNWSVPGNVPAGPIQMLVSHDDGSGRALYAGGAFTYAGTLVNGIARWNGATWSSLGSGLNGTPYAAVTFDDGSGSALYVAGEFSTAGGIPALRVARWNGASWSAVGTGFNAAVFALSVFDDGTGAQLYAAGDFTGLNGQAAARIARWNGTTWSALGAGLNSTAKCLAVHDDGSGSALYVGGDFTSAGGIDARKVARWRAGAWESVSVPGTTLYPVETLREYDAGSGVDLYAGGPFGGYGTAPFRIARWDGSVWNEVDGGIGDEEGGGAVYALASYDDGTGRRLVAAGTFADAGTQAVTNIADWDGVAWRAFAPGNGLDDIGWALAVHDDGNGRELFLAGLFDAAGSAHARRVASWDGASWSTLGQGLGTGIQTAMPRALRSFDDGSGPALYVAGNFSTASGVPAARIARWSAGFWSALGSGLSTGGVYALREYDAGSGARLFAAGDFDFAGGQTAPNIAAWDGASWAAVGAGLDGVVRALEVFDSGQGPELVAGGRFRLAPGQPYERLAAWNGTSWRTLGFGPSTSSDDRLDALATWHDGTVESLYAGGSFTLAAGLPCANIARWDGSAWSALGSGTSGAVRALATFPGPAGTSLCVGGTFGTAGGVLVENVARWDGSVWSALETAVNSSPGSVTALAAYDAGDGAGPVLFATGSFTSLGGHLARNITSYSQCGVAGRVVCPGDGSGAACPCGNPSVPGAGAGCVNSTGNAGTLRARGLASLSQDTLVLEGTGMTNGFALHFQGTQRLAGGAGVAFGDGLRCAGGNVVRLEVLLNTGGSSTYPRPGDAPVATKGLVTAPGTRVYQIWFRDAASFCTSSTFNLTNALEIVWQR